jgi:hypothetical protein
MSSATAAQAAPVLTLADELADVEAAIATTEHEAYLVAAHEALVGAGRMHPATRRAELARLMSEALGDGAFGPLYPAEEVGRWLTHVADGGYAQANPERPRDTAHERNLLLALARREQVPNARFRERFQALRGGDGDGVAAQRLGLKVGETRRHPRTGETIGDGTRVERLLGLASVQPRPGRPPSLRLFIPYEMAVRFADALSVPYHECGV